MPITIRNKTQMFIPVSVQLERGKGTLVHIPHPLPGSRGYFLEVWIPSRFLNEYDEIPLWLYGKKVEERTTEKNKENPVYRIFTADEAIDIACRYL